SALRRRAFSSGELSSCSSCSRRTTASHSPRARCRSLAEASRYAGSLRSSAAPNSEIAPFSATHASGASASTCNVPSASRIVSELMYHPSEMPAHPYTTGCGRPAEYAFGPPAYKPCKSAICMTFLVSPRCYITPGRSCFQGVQQRQLAAHGLGVGARRAGIGERRSRGLQPAELDQRPRAPKVRVGQLGTGGEDPVVLRQRVRGPPVVQRERGEPDPVGEILRGGDKACQVRSARASARAQAHPNDPQGVPALAVGGVAPERLGEARLGELRLSPARRAQPARARSGRVRRSHLRGAIVGFERRVVAVRELVGVPELDVRRRAVGAE